MPRLCYCVCGSGAVGYEFRRDMIDKVKPFVVVNVRRNGRTPAKGKTPHGLRGAAYACRKHIPG